MTTFELQFPAGAIEALASRFGYSDDARLLATGAAARARGYYTHGEFIAVCAWKTVRSRSTVATNTEGAVAKRLGGHSSPSASSPGRNIR